MLWRSFSLHLPAFRSPDLQITGTPDAPVVPVRFPRSLATCCGDLFPFLYPPSAHPFSISTGSPDAPVVPVRFPPSLATSCGNSFFVHVPASPMTSALSECSAIMLRSRQSQRFSPAANFPLGPPASTIFRFPKISGGGHAICTACFCEKRRCSGDGRHNERRVSGAVRRVKKKVECGRAVLGGLSSLCHGAGHQGGTEPAEVEQPEFSLG